tara:strand:- start:810 stop:1016 length:207 start_codon:yes stop_codon:yes gene_type:complete
MREWLDYHRTRASAKAPLGEALGYIAKYWPGLVLFLTDGRIELDNNAIERIHRRRPAPVTHSPRLSLP